MQAKQSMFVNMFYWARYAEFHKCIKPNCSVSSGDKKQLFLNKSTRDNRSVKEMSCSVTAAKEETAQDLRCVFVVCVEGYLLCIYLGPAALLAQQVSVVVRLLPLLLVGVSPHQLPVTQVVDLFPLLLAADTLLISGPGLNQIVRVTHQQWAVQICRGRTIPRS